MRPMLEQVPFQPIVESITLSESKGIERKDPKLAVMALEMLCVGHGYREVELATGIKFDQLIGLRTRHEPAMEVRRKQLAEDGFELAEGLRLLVKEKMVNLANNPKEMQKVNIRDLVMSYGVVVEKGMIAADGNRTIIEHVSKRPTLEDAKKAIEEARRALQKEAIPI